MALLPLPRLTLTRILPLRALFLAVLLPRLLSLLRGLAGGISRAAFGTLTLAKASRDLLASLGRFSEPALHILIALADGPKHGYAMMLEIESLSGSRPGPGTLYGAIARLEERGWIAPLAADDRRRPYRLTSTGRSVLRVRLDALQAMTAAAKARLRHA